MKTTRVLVLTGVSMLLAGCTVIPLQDAGAGPDDAAVCSCADVDCGDDGCGGTCGSCSAGEVCVNGRCECTPSCAGGRCGDDGCGGTCPGCSVGEACVDGRCECAPSCAGRECGNDGCDGSCGTCGTGERCNELLGACECVPVTCHRDWDGDGYPAESETVSACDCPDEYMLPRADGKWDCDDGLERRHPGASWCAFCPGQRDGGGGLGVICSHYSHECNCDGVVEPRWTDSGGVCLVSSSGGCGFARAGWVGGVVPACGERGDWVTGCDGMCRAEIIDRYQECR